MHRVSGTLNKLTDAKARSETKPGRHSDGGGLYLDVSPAGTKSRLAMWTSQGKRREIGNAAGPLVFYRLLARPRFAGALTSGFRPSPIFFAKAERVAA